MSAILCLIKEIDGPSLEVVEMAVRYVRDRGQGRHGETEDRGRHGETEDRGRHSDTEDSG